MNNPKNKKNDSFYSDSNQTLLRKSLKEMEETRGTIHDIDLDSDNQTRESHQ